ncbi:MAG: flagella basal body P-ring formation protein FlgA, partial [Phycisphaerales bacterium]|nr:flagella basal body P-ring formation protein FlgA [Phycisphaerales bacterium]
RDEAVGRSAVRRVDAGETIARRDIQPVEVVDRGDHVFVRVVIGRHAIKVEAEALQAGAIGDRIMLRRIGPGAKRDRQPFPATVSGTGEAVIEGDELMVAAGA